MGGGGGAVLTVHCEIVSHVGMRSDRDYLKDYGLKVVGPFKMTEEESEQFVKQS